MYISVFALSFIAQIPLIVGRFLPLHEIKFFSLDEFSLLQVIIRYQNHLLSGDFSAFFTDKLEYSYGFLFYAIYSVITIPFRYIGGELGVLFAGRTISAALTALSICIFIKIFSLIHNSRIVLISVAALMATLPVLTLYHKPLSAEQLSIFIISFSLLLLITIKRNQFLKSVALVSILSAVAASVKLNVLLVAPTFLILISFAMFRYILPGTDVTMKPAFSIRSKFSIQFASSIFAGIPLFFLCNLPILISEQSRKNYINQIFSQMASNNNSQGGLVFFEGLNDWLLVIDKNVFSFKLILIVILLSIFSSFWLALRRHYGKAIIGLALIIWLLVPMIYVLVTVTKPWFWYLTLPMYSIFVFIPLTSFIAWDFLGSIKYEPLSKAAKTLIPIFFLFIFAPGTFSKYIDIMDQRVKDIQNPAFLEMRAIASQLNLKVGDLKKGSYVLVDPYNTFNINSWHSRGLKVKTNWSHRTNLDWLKMHKPDLVIARFQKFSQHQGNPKNARSKFEKLLNKSCVIGGCYSKIIHGKLSETYVYVRLYE